MASDINRVILIGRLTKSPELKSTNGGTHFCRFSLASNHTRKQQDGSYKDEAGFFECVAWGKSAEILHKYVQKGHRLAVEGALRWSSWEAEGKKHSKVEILVEQFNFLERKDSGQPGEPSAAAFNADDTDIPF